MLLQNITLHAQYPYRRCGASTTATEAGSLRSQLGIRGSSQLTRFCSGWYKWQSIPQGYGVGSSIFAPLKGGGLGVSANAGGLAGTSTATGAMAMGKACTATLAGVGEITPPNLSLLVQLAATILAEGLIDNAAMVGTVNMAATLAGQGDIDGALGMLAWATATLTGSGTVDASTSMYGIAHMSADITPYTSLSPETLAAAVWNALATSFNDPGTMGEKVNAAGTAGDPWTADLTGYAADTAGDIVNSKLLRTLKFLALK